LFSYNLDSIIDDARQALSDGCKEIWITAEDTAAYRCGDQRLPDLLKKISSLKGQFYVRVGMMTPNQASEVLKELLEAYRSEKIFKFLHLPVQSGNDEILNNMQRRYTVQDFQKIVLRFRELIPDLSLSTDIICGFPGETEEQFRDSLRLINIIKPDVLNISRFWPRPCTKASEMENKLHGREIKKRSRIMTKFWRSLSHDKCVDWLGWRGEVLIDESLPEGKVIGRNYAYKPIVIKTNEQLGHFVNVITTEARSGYLIGNLTQQSRL
jgi:MiaB/RimO family radical SAM methylthiotransferase